MTLKQTRKLALGLFKVHGLKGWKLSFSVSVDVIGACLHERKTIYVSGPLAFVNSEEVMREALLHEIAHALLPARAGHGKKWKVLAKKIGAGNRPYFSWGLYKQIGKGYTPSLWCPNGCGVVVTGYDGDPFVFDLYCSICLAETSDPAQSRLEVALP